ncbi:hypothetical protein PAQ31011_01181 [Pandoraea aquatica]|uniref:Uncharacterized protein n=1 Tax=Pandoraea aquatica TaxID=2508290 RepID=A0A5E4T2X5_9BURK|nr:hypothetical protein [Pandoraea aquatica]VVD82450.1 hypothetical protein PAQ31011_01181 [Pandoraea aquatica]
MAHDSTPRFSSRALSAPPLKTSLRKMLWMTLPVAIAAALFVSPHARAQNTAAPANGTGAAPAGGSSVFNPSADISRAVSRDTTDTAIQNNWNTITRPPAPKAEEKPPETPRRNRRGITPGISTN